MATRIELNYDYEKAKTALRYWLLGKGWHIASEAMELGLKYHVGERKNGNPEFSHQIFQAQYARTLPALMNPEATIAVIFLHDIVEDHSVTVKDIYDGFGPLIGLGVDLMTDSDEQGNDRPPELYYPAMVASPLTSIAKGIDRMHNFQSMRTAFDIAKQKRYIVETRTHILPMMKLARKKYPQQEPAYQNIKHVLLTQIELILAMHDADAVLAPRTKRIKA